MREHAVVGGRRRFGLEVSECVPMRADVVLGAARANGVDICLIRSDRENDVRSRRKTREIFLVQLDYGSLAELGDLEGCGRAVIRDVNGISGGLDFGYKVASGCECAQDSQVGRCETLYGQVAETARGLEDGKALAVPVALYENATEIDGVASEVQVAEAARC